MFHSLPRNSEEWRIKNPISLVLRWQNIKPSALDSRNHGSRQWWTMGYEVIPGANRDVLLKLLNSPFNFTGEFEDSRIESWPGWFVETEKFLTIRIFPSWIPNLSLTFRLQFRISSLEFEKYFLFRICKRRKKIMRYGSWLHWRLSSWRIFQVNEMETSKIERIVFWLILHAFFNNFFYHLLILWLNNKLSIDNIHDSRVIPLDNRQKNLVIITISCSWWSKLLRF